MASSGVGFQPLVLPPSLHFLSVALAVAVAGNLTPNSFGGLSVSVAAKHESGAEHRQGKGPARATATEENHTCGE